MMGYLLGSEDGGKDKPTVKAVGAVAFCYACYLWGTNAGMKGIKAGMKGYFYGYREGKIVLFFQITEVTK